MARLAIWSAIATLFAPLSYGVAHRDDPLGSGNASCLSGNMSVGAGGVAAAASTDNAPAGKPFKIGRDRDGMFYLPARVNGTPVRFLMDTGANVIVLAPADVSRLGLKGGEPRTLRTAGGRLATRQFTLHQLDMGGRRLRGIPAVLGHEGLPASLLGQNVLAQLGPIVIDDEEISIGGGPGLAGPGD